jgi:hypothetical protein
MSVVMAVVVHEREGMNELSNTGNLLSKEKVHYLFYNRQRTPTSFGCWVTRYEFVV